MCNRPKWVSLYKEIGAFLDNFGGAIGYQLGDTLQITPKVLSPKYFKSHALTSLTEDWIVALHKEDALKLAKQKYGEDTTEDMLEQDHDVLDTWFSSGLFPISTLGWPWVRHTSVS